MEQSSFLTDWDTFEIVDQTFLQLISPLVVLPGHHVLGTGRELDFLICRRSRRRWAHHRSTPFYWTHR